MNEFIQIGGYIARVSDVTSVCLGDNKEGPPTITVVDKSGSAEVTFADYKKRDATWDIVVRQLGSMGELI